MADYKALSENMMHADIRTTDDTYGLLSSEEVKKRIAGLFSKVDVQASPSTGLENIPNRVLKNALHVIASLPSRSGGDRRERSNLIILVRKPRLLRRFAPPASPWRSRGGARNDKSRLFQHPANEKLSEMLIEVAKRLSK